MAGEELIGAGGGVERKESAENNGVIDSKEGEKR
jgi:hypothetical protein